MRAIFVLMMLLASRCTFAQTACPQGVTAGSALCGPSMQGGYQDAPMPAVRYIPTGRWHSRWGALAMDRKLGRTGASADMETEELARADALKQCKKLETASCTIDIVYSNGCIAMAWPIEGGFVINNVARDLEAAESGAMARCKEKNSTACAIKYTDCSKAVYEYY